MKLYGVLVLLVTLSAACGLRCYSCVSTSVTNVSACVDIKNCQPIEDRCYTLEYNGYIAKGCLINPGCESPIVCCKGDLCNSAITAGSSILLLLVSSAITTVFL